MVDILIAHINRFVPLTEDERAEVVKAVKAIHVKRKHFLLQPGEICRNNYFVSKGVMRLYFINRNGQEQITMFGIENWWITDYDSLESGRPSHYYIQAVEDSELISINKTSIEELLLKVPKMERYFRIILQRAFTATMRRIEYFRDQSDEELYRMFAAMFPEFIQRIPQYMLASYLGFTPQFLSKIRGKKTESPHKPESPKDLD
jgi:CRP/FNR family transcriptional regulator